MDEQTLLQSLEGPEEPRKSGAFLMSPDMEEKDLLKTLDPVRPILEEAEVPSGETMERVYTPSEREEVGKRLTDTYIIGSMYDMEAELAWEMAPQIREREAEAIKNPPPSLRDWIYSVPTALNAGGVDAAAMYLKAANVLSGVDNDKEIKAVEKFARDIGPVERDSELYRSITEGIQSTVQSALCGIPGGLVGLLGGAPGAYGGVVLSAGTLFGLSVFYDFMREADELGIPRKDVLPEAILAGVAEGGIEALTDAAWLKVTGILVKPTISAGVKRGLLAAFRRFAKKTGSIAAFEIPGEMTTEAFQTFMEIEAGFPREYTPFEAAKEVIGPTLVQTVLMSVVGAGAGKVKTKIAERKARKKWAQVEEKIAKREQARDAFVEEHGEVPFEARPIEGAFLEERDVKVLAHPAPEGGGKWRVTWIDKDGPFAHTLYDSHREMVEDYRQEIDWETAKARVLPPVKDYVLEKIEERGKKGQATAAEKDYYDEFGVRELRPKKRGRSGIVAYHGTRDKIDVFQPLSHFGTEQAARDALLSVKGKEKAQVIEARLNIKNPLEVTDTSGTGAEEVIAWAMEAQDKDVITEEEMERIEEVYMEDIGKGTQLFIDTLQARGYDGLKYINKTEDPGSTSWVVFSPDQVMRTGEPKKKIKPRVEPEKLIEGRTVEAPTYMEAEKTAKETENITIRPKEAAHKGNKGRTLLVQFSSRILPGGEEALAERYYDMLYSGTREGYVRPTDFWEIPEWVGVAAKNISESDVYVIRNVDKAVEYFNKAGYDTIAFSALEVNKEMIKKVAEGYKGKIVVGGYGSLEEFAGIPNVETFSTMEEFITSKGLKFEEGVDYRHFKGTEVIPRLCLSEGCLHKCAFCDVQPHGKVVSRGPENVKAQVEAIKDLKAKLVYLNDKTFGQSSNYKDLPQIFKELKKANRKFEGFIVQTTAAQMAKLDAEWMKEAGVQYVELGVESYNNEILKKFKKPATEKSIDKAVEKIRKAGLKFIPNIIIGSEGETKKTYARTRKFLEDNADIISHVNAYNLAVYEGTDLEKSLGQDLAVTDINENVVEKSWHKTEAEKEVHREFARWLYNWSQRRLRQPVGGRPGVEVFEVSADRMGELYGKVEEEGGFTYDLLKDVDMRGRALFAVSAYPEREQSFTREEFRKEDIQGYIEDNYDLLSQQGNVLGAWVDDTRNIVVLDISKTVTSEAKALEIMKANGQEAIYDLKNEVEIREYEPVGEYEQKVVAGAVAPKWAGIREFFPKRKPRATSAVLDFIQREGGINPAEAQGETRRFSVKESGYPGLVSKKGLDPDVMRERLQEEGFLSEISTVNDLWDIMDEEVFRAKFGPTESDISVGDLLGEIEEYKKGVKEAEAAVRRYVKGKEKEAVAKAREKVKKLKDKQRERKALRQRIERLARVVMKPAGQKVDFYYREAIENIQQGIDPKFRAKKTIEMRERTRQFLKSNPDRLRDIPTKLLRRLQSRALNEYTVRDLEEMAIEVTRLRREGLLKQRLKVQQEWHEIDVLLEPLIRTVLKGKRLEPKGPFTPVTAQEGREWERFRQARVSFLRPSRMVDILDGGQNFRGPLHDLFINEVNRIYDLFLVAQHERTEHGKEKLADLGIDLRTLGEVRVVNNVKYTVDSMIDIYIGIKNERKRAAIIYGNEIPESDHKAIIEALTPAERELGDWIIKEYDQHYMRLREAFIEYKNEDMGFEPFYSPIRRVDLDPENFAEELAKELESRQGFKKVYVKRGMTYRRQDLPEHLQKKIRLGAYSAWLEQVQSQEQFIHYAELVKKLHRVIADGAFQQAVEQRYGRAYIESLKDYVNTVANPNVYKAFTGLDKACQALRKNAVLAYLAFNLATMGKQLPSVAYYMGEAGPGHLVAAMAEFVAHPFESIEFVKMMDPQMRYRGIEREMEELKNIIGEKGMTHIIRTVGRHGLYGIKMFDRVAITIGWKAVYNKCIAQHMSEQEAVREAQNATLRTQPAAAPKDLAKIYRSNEMLNVMTQFTNQLSNIYQMTVHDIPADVREGRYWTAFCRSSGLAIGAMGIWMIVNRAIPDDPEDVLDAIKDMFINMIPIFGRSISAASRGWDSSGFPVTDAGKKVVKAVKAGRTQKTIEAALELMCLLFGFPYIGVKRPVDVVVEGDFGRLLGGPRKKKKKVKW